MVRNIAVAVLLVSSVAHAEYLAPAQGDVVRPPTVQRTAKPARAAVRATVGTRMPAELPTVADTARGLDIDDVLAKVNGAYMAGLQRCYRKAFAADPYMSSKVDLQFKVTAEGRVMSTMQGEGMERCLSTMMSGWRFGVALNDAGEPTETSFKISLVLR